MNMNMDDYNRANEIIGGELGNMTNILNDHVNYGQSTNDVVQLLENCSSIYDKRLISFFTRTL